MWRMLTAEARDLEVELLRLRRPRRLGHRALARALRRSPRPAARWSTRCSRAFRFADGRIAEHADSFSFHSWAWQALGVRARDPRHVEGRPRRRAAARAQAPARVHGRGWMTGSPELRASDADRERAVGRLREHSLAGRLTVEELDERSAAAFAATTVGELDALLADLPRERAPAAPPAGAGGRPSRAGSAGARSPYVFEHPVRPGKAMEHALATMAPRSPRRLRARGARRRAAGVRLRLPPGLGGDPLHPDPVPGPAVPADQGPRPRHGRVRAARRGAGRGRSCAAARRGGCGARSPGSGRPERAPTARSGRSQERADTGSHALLRPPPRPAARRSPRAPAASPSCSPAPLRRRRRSTSPRRRPRPRHDPGEDRGAVLRRRGAEPLRHPREQGRVRACSRAPRWRSPCTCSTPPPTAPRSPAHVDVWRANAAGRHPPLAARPPHRRRPGRPRPPARRRAADRPRAAVARRPHARAPQPVTLRAGKRTLRLPIETGTRAGGAQLTLVPDRRGGQPPRHPPHGPRAAPPLSALLLALRLALLDLVAELGHHVRVAQRGDVAELAALGDVAQQPAHDLARAGLGQVVGPDDPLRPRELADPLRDVLADVADQLVGRRRRRPRASRTRSRTGPCPRRPGRSPPPRRRASRRRSPTRSRRSTSGGRRR